MRRGRAAGRAAAVAIAAVAAGCGGSDDEPQRVATVPGHIVPARPLAAGPGLVEPAPVWTRRFCAQVARRSTLRCPSVVPADFAPPGIGQEAPTRRGFVLIGAVADAIWRIEGRSGVDAGPLAAARVVSRSDRGFELGWSTYLVAYEGADEPRARRQARAVAASIGP